MQDITCKLYLQLYHPTAKIHMKLGPTSRGTHIISATELFFHMNLFF